jgi:hypothetical protein
MKSNIFKNQTIPLASKSKRDITATLAITTTTLKETFHRFMVNISWDRGQPEEYRTSRGMLEG